MSKITNATQYYLNHGLNDLLLNSVRNSLLNGLGLVGVILLSLSRQLLSSSSDWLSLGLLHKGYRQKKEEWKQRDSQKTMRVMKTKSIQLS